MQRDKETSVRHVGLQQQRCCAVFGGLVMKWADMALVTASLVLRPGSLVRLIASLDEGK